MLRISEENKADIEAAAKRGQKSVTAFITGAALKQARQTERRPPAQGVHGGVPTFFRALCAEAANGGQYGYRSAASALAGSLGSQIPDDLNLDDWQVHVDELLESLKDEDVDKTWAWFKRHYPKCMALVPTRRRDQFVAGVQDAHHEGRVEL